MDPNPHVDPFNRDAVSNAGYIYTTNTRLSSRLATQRSTEAILQMRPFTGRAVLDVGCGDGFYTLQFWDQGRPRAMTGVDMADKAIALANTKKGERPIKFEVGDAHHLSYPNDSFDVVLIQSILHHDFDPLEIIREALRVAPEVLIHEPNGLNLGLKIIEKTSAYHREHGERSFTPQQVKRWIKQAGGNTVSYRLAGFVPMFCPDLLAKTMKKAESIVERLPLLNLIGCAVFVLVATRSDLRT